MSNLDIPIALALIVGGILAYLVWVHVQAAERMSRRLRALQREVSAHPGCAKEAIMGSATVQELRIEEAEAERKRIVESFGLPRVQIERLADADALTADEYQSLRRLRALEWLLRAEDARGRGTS